jgi:hypothetical protein
MPSNALLSCVTLVAWGTILFVLGFGLTWPFQKASTRVKGIAIAILVGFSPIILQLARGRDWTDLLLPMWPMQGGVELVFQPAKLAAGGLSDDLVMILNAGALPIGLNRDPVGRTQLEAPPEYHRENCRSGALNLGALYSTVVAAVVLLIAGFVALVALVTRYFHRARRADVIPS